jgi:membrane-associated phospholipid phosphatase
MPRTVLLTLRAAEWINLAVFSFYTVLGWRRGRLSPQRRAKITAIGASAVLITLLVSQVVPRFVTPLAASVIRDWVPYALLLLLYWQGGQFVTHADLALEERLERIDRKVVAPLLQSFARAPLGGWILDYLEGAYLFCYASMPLGLGTLYMLRRGREADHYWTVVLLAAYTAYGMLPFIQLRPPRMLGEKWSEALLSGKVRSLNLWILRHASIHANTFPSGHVAAATACALILLRVAPLWVGLVFLFLAVSIALAAVIGRYHYVADAILGVLVATVAFLADTAVAAFTR